MSKRVLFFSSVPNKELFKITGFYDTDINILSDLGFDVITSNSFKDFLKFWKYDIVFIYFWTKGLVPAAISKLFRKKVIFTGGIDSIDKEFNKSISDYRQKKILFRLCTLCSDANIIVSETDMNNIFKTNYKINNLHLIPHVIDFDKYKYDNRLKENIITTIVWMGAKGNVCRKGVDKLLRVYKEFLKYDDTFKVIIIGTLGPGTEYLQQIASELNIAERVIFTGGISEEEKIDYLKRSKIYFQLSEYEGFGIAAVEALAAGNVVIHSGKGGLSFTLKSFAFKVEDTSDYENIASLLDHVTTNYGNYRDLVSQGMKHVKDNFSYNVRKEKIGSLMNSLFDSESRVEQ